MKESQTESKSLWQKTPVSNLVRYVPSGILFARMKVQGKLIRRSLKSKCLSVGKLRLSDLEKQERQMAENASTLSEGKMTFGDALQIYHLRLHGDASLKPRTKAHREERIAVLLKTCPSLQTTDVCKITKQDSRACLQSSSLPPRISRLPSNRLTYWASPKTARVSNRLT